MHVLIISNSNSNLQWVTAPLAATGLTVNTVNAYSMEEAITLMHAIKFDMVLYDLAFSEKVMSENFKKLTDLGTQIPLIALTDNTGDPNAGEAIKCGAISHLVKDRLQVSAMAETLKSILLQQQLNYN
jgi:DNA-binding NtrC family response regulator